MSINGQLLEVTVKACSELKGAAWMTRLDPFVCLQYAGTNFRTRTCTHGGKNPVFEEKTVIPLIEGLRLIDVAVWNSKTVTSNAFICRGRILLHRVLTEGFDDSSWPLQSESGKHAGEVRVMMYYANARKARVTLTALACLSTAFKKLAVKLTKPAEPPVIPGYIRTVVYYPAPPYAPHYPSEPVAAPWYTPTAAEDAPDPGGYPVSYPPTPDHPRAYPPGQTYPPGTAYQPQPSPPRPQAQPFPPRLYPEVYPPPPY